jgi:tetratricopeptide (TPR) repeat protein
MRAWASVDRGALADAEADARWALERAEGVRRIHAVTELIRVLIERDELQAAEDVLAQLPDPRASGSAQATRFLVARGQLRRAEGRLQEALEDFLECGQRWARLGLSMLTTWWRGEAALIYAALGNTADARRLANEQLALARASGRPRALGISLRASGLIEGGEPGLQLLAEAVQTLERSQSPLELARALSDHGAALRRAGRRVQARAELERALDLAYRLGARRIANRARSGGRHAFCVSAVVECNQLLRDVSTCDSGFAVTVRRCRGCGRRSGCGMLSGPSSSRRCASISVAHG